MGTKHQIQLTECYADYEDEDDGGKEDSEAIDLYEEMQEYQNGGNDTMQAINVPLMEENKNVGAISEKVNVVSWSKSSGAKINVPADEKPLSPTSENIKTDKIGPSPFIYKCLLISQCSILLTLILFLGIITVGIIFYFKPSYLGIHEESSPNLTTETCFISGECKTMTLISQNIVLGEEACLRFCQKTDGCKWFTYHKLNMVCNILSTCKDISTSTCADCLTGSSTCAARGKKCWSNGICDGNTISKTKQHTFEDCGNFCQSNPNCEWFTFDTVESRCHLFQECLALDKSCLSCITSGKTCKKIAPSHLTCFVEGQCQSSKRLRQVTTMGEGACLRFCQKTDGCHWFTYKKSTMICETFRTCEQFSNLNCKDCISGASNCVSHDKKCWARGSCEGQSYKQLNSDSMENCQRFCQSDSNCHWHTFDIKLSQCHLFTDCPSINMDCKTCTTSGTSCKGLTGSFKVMVATGHNGNNLNSVEVIDLETSTSTSTSACQNLQNYPLSHNGASGSLMFDERPLLCGGTSSTSNCYVFENGMWNRTHSLQTQNYYQAMVSLPIKDFPKQIMLSGGSSNSRYTQKLTSSGWTYIPSLFPTDKYAPCAVSLNSTSIMIIGGSSSVTTFIIHSDGNGDWIPGPQLLRNRQYHACSMIKESEINSFSFSVIVAGGSGPLSSVEILDEGSNTWRNGQDLPVGLYGLTMVGDPLGGVVVIGGWNNGARDRLYRLPNADSKTQWLEMPQRLKEARHFQVSFIIPEQITNCTYN